MVPLGLCLLLPDAILSETGHDASLLGVQCSGALTVMLVSVFLPGTRTWPE